MILYFKKGAKPFCHPTQHFGQCEMLMEERRDSGHAGVGKNLHPQINCNDFRGAKEPLATESQRIITDTMPTSHVKVHPQKGSAFFVFYHRVTG